MKMLKCLVYTAFLIAVITLSACSINRKPINEQELINYCVDKVKTTMLSLNEADSLPRNIYPNQTKWNKVGIHDWTSGFWPGLLWYAYETSGDQEILNYAEKFTEPLKGVLDVPVDNHDLGFMLYCSFGNGYRLTKNKDYHDFLLVAADSLATLYNPKVGTILSWPVMVEKMNWPHNTIIDNMINLELLFWASKNGGGQHLYDIADTHAKTCMTTLIRPDYTTYHVAVFDTTDGHFIKGVTHQGYADDSQWARGQGWGIYGYAMCYRETGNEDFLTTSQKLADVLLERLPEDGIPYWDFDDPEIPNAPKDASAAAVAASGMLELSQLVKSKALQQKYFNAAVEMLTNLSNENYLSRDINQAMLLHSTGHKPNNSEIDVSIIYADYYYLEALLRLKKIREAM
ncbi:glycoside hydrolase family 88 protein [Saccharicrinis fermentans]|uniref:Unsaturated glucuronyl hydrolase n=1 Tax=Saccharicrinis fermentans DSM 9555 = JCM 21142 TaxID=869213 RepID=W7XV75_9BACT|nr:glycoside hydrolase family 88 protein [Saccharicrinis fermentans]GAF01980.1 unsaturated glucuronyl hydrolase [Saccharicrinis fermentans DSM 9555 = JCM 21142]